MSDDWLSMRGAVQLPPASAWPPLPACVRECAGCTHVQLYGGLMHLQCDDHSRLIVLDADSTGDWPPLQSLAVCRRAALGPGTLCVQENVARESNEAEKSVADTKLLVCSSELDGVTWASMPPLPAAVRAVAAGAAHCAAVLHDGTLWCRGLNDVQQCGAPEHVSVVPHFVPVATLPAAEQVIAAECGHNFTVALAVSGSAISFGFNAHGELAHGAGTYGVGYRAPGLVHVQPVDDDNAQKKGGRKIKAVAAGATHAVFVDTDGTAYVSGEGALAGGEGGCVATPIDTLCTFRIVSASCGIRHTLFKSANGDVLAAGENEFGQRGDDAVDATNDDKDARPGEPVLLNSVHGTLPFATDFASLFVTRRR